MTSVNGRRIFYLNVGTLVVWDRLNEYKIYSSFRPAAIAYFEPSLRGWYHHRNPRRSGAFCASGGKEPCRVKLCGYVQFDYLPML